MTSLALASEAPHAPHSGAEVTDRIRSPSAIVRAMRPHFEKLGITRVARQTGLDRIGVPCFAAIRPNAATLAVNQGKGLDDDAAEASAIMEATEYSIAEAPGITSRCLSIDELNAAGHGWLDPSHLLPRDAALPRDRAIRWVEGTELRTGATILVPYEGVVIGRTPRDLPGISQSTTGLASGNCADEAIFHALCELVERDAASLWAFKSDNGVRNTAVAAEAFGDASVDRLADQIRAAGFQLNLFDQTTDLGIPCILAALSPADRRPSLHFDLATGAGCHPVAARAAIRAITEAAQTRISNIAGARDDFHPSEYQLALTPSLAALAEPMPARRGAPAGVGGATGLPHLLRTAKGGISESISTPTVIVHLGGGDYGISVVKALSPGLEDRLANRNWRPGPRATAAMVRFW